MSNPRQSRRQQYLTPERREEDDIDRRGTKRRQSITDYTNQRAEKERAEPQDAQGESLLEKYEQRLQRTSSERPTTLLSATESSSSSHQRVHTARGREDNPTFCIQGRSQKYHGLGYELPGSEGQLTEEKDTLSSFEEAPSFQEFAREQVVGQAEPTWE
ncbi:hypothetical protein SARC_01330 [Sphaeroforma arctica JP610]|uniref:Uncharacterized protein n=1 Tax=Sphaeroforma arctica JP610 TaxID=667725 RepID=A0A0L0GC19_9EUKA|nr:hypothetical protein SARC_01330 [Sphaeroforma arctica JP610]KNC86557.1 hypothetical protein SARC_01330 [Sphaeroforma arctica JP610]|eukprot:XP_014160459.1 hypothetical protein SARC_01330 [Sphaeroforma arctica JP610]